MRCRSVLCDGWADAAVDELGAAIAIADDNAADTLVLHVSAIADALWPAPEPASAAIARIMVIMRDIARCDHRNNRGGIGHDLNL